MGQEKPFLTDHFSFDLVEDSRGVLLKPEEAERKFRSDDRFKRFLDDYPAIVYVNVDDLTNVHLPPEGVDRKKEVIIKFTLEEVAS
ncbi:MAG: hypothetical protein QGF74_01445 [Candidatus Nanoarchaeia archaeon]|nr:hypothetical protein [Candidatus Nanoarchaeia archaeon]